MEDLLALVGAHSCPVGDVVDGGAEDAFVHFGVVDGLGFREHEKDVGDAGLDVVEGKDHEAAFLIVYALCEELEEFEGDLGIAFHEDFEVCPVELEGDHLVDGDGGGGTGHFLEYGHFTEYFAGVEDVDILFDVVHYFDYLHSSGLDEVEGVAWFVFAEDDVSCLVGFGKAAEH